MTRPVDDGPALRHGGFWVPGERERTSSGTRRRAPMWVERLVPADGARLVPLVLVHGGGGQGTDWLTTPDGRPGWAPLLAAAGHPVYVVDRPGHGRSRGAGPHDGAGGPMPTEAVVAVFAPPDRAEAHHQWPWRRDVDGPEIMQLAASTGAPPADLAACHELDGGRLSALVDQVGPAVLITHSAGAPGGWVAASRSRSVRGVVAVEPMGPPYADVPGFGILTAGLTAVPLPDRGLDGVPIRVVTGEASPFAGVAPAVVDHLRGLGAEARQVPLESVGVTGNGHAPMLERNSAETAAVVAGLIRDLG